MRQTFTFHITLSTSQLRTTKHLWIVWEANAKMARKFKVKIGARKYKRCLVISKEKPQKLFAQFVPCLMTAAVYHTFPSNNQKSALVERVSVSK